MQFLRTPLELGAFLTKPENCTGCLADTGFLYALSYKDDRLFNHATDVFDLLADHKVGLYANVISRLEFVDLIFRKQITNGAISLLGTVNPTTTQKSLFNLLKNIRDTNKGEANVGNSYKINEGRLKNLRKELEAAAGQGSWKSFCETYSGVYLKNDWETLEQDLGLDFIEIMEGAQSELFASPLYWKDMVQVMGNLGVRGPDAMIMNLFLKSKLPLLITGDSDYEVCFSDPGFQNPQKAVYLLS